MIAKSKSARMNFFKILFPIFCVVLLCADLIAQEMYNYQAPYWVAYSSNYIDLTDNFDQPVLDYMDHGREHAKMLLGVKGIYYPAGIGPKGLATTRWPLTSEEMQKRYATQNNRIDSGYKFLGQKINAVFSVGNMLMRFYSTYDESYAKRVYPYLLGITSLAVPLTINEMLLQSYEGVVRIFPNLNYKKDASFNKLRAYGAFVVSSEPPNGRITHVKIESEKGRVCTLENPWPGRNVAVIRNGKRMGVLNGNILYFKTTKGEVIRLEMAGKGISSEIWELNTVANCPQIVALSYRVF